jgi:RNA polymerase sigma factor for flagellar operon FliA
MSATAADLHTQQLHQYRPMVRRVAQHMRSRLPASVELDDLIQAGMIGLSEAIRRCDPAEGELEKFAMVRIRGAMLDEARASDWAARGCRKGRRDIEQAAQRLQQRLCRQPSESEIAAELGLALGDYQALLAKLHRAQIVHLDDLGPQHQDSDDDSDDGLHTTPLGDWGADPMSRLGQQRLQQALVDAIHGLPEREQQVMLHLYEDDMKLRDIGAALGVSESRVSQLHRQAIGLLRQRLQLH